MIQVRGVKRLVLVFLIADAEVVGRCDSLLIHSQNLQSRNNVRIITKCNLSQL